MPRTIKTNRKTNETDIEVEWDLDNENQSVIETGIGFLDHMLTALAKHSKTSLKIKCKGDLEIDGHHTTEDIGIVLGQAFKDVLGDCIGIERFGNSAVPLDEALVNATVDISGRPHLEYNLRPMAPTLGDWDTELVSEFFRGFTAHAKICLHLHQVCGTNSHHIIEAAFKAFARAIKQAIEITGTTIPSTKGCI